MNPAFRIYNKVTVQFTYRFRAMSTCCKIAGIACLEFIVILKVVQDCRYTGESVEDELF